MSSAPPPTLEELAQEFASDLTKTVRAVVPDAGPFSAVALQAAGATAVTVLQSPASGITLVADGTPVLTLTVEFQCTWDGHGEFLAVQSSAITVWPRDDVGTEPLFRYEYLREMRHPRRPAAHLQIHGDHPALTDAWSGVGTGSTSGRRLRKRITAGKMPQLPDLHFPVGGHRFRPCLEDVLEVLIEEFGVTPAGELQDVLRVLADGRESWRRKQVAAVVRDAPDVALKVLGAYYDITPKPGKTPPAPKPDRLRQL